MAKVAVIYGSTTGMTEAAAMQLAAALGGEATPIAAATPETFDADLILLGSSTWGYGELQDDWASGIALLDSVDLSGRKVAVFGTGDSCGFADTFCNAIGILADKAVERGATIVGQVPTEGYQATESLAVRDGMFIGLALDDTNESDQTPGRIDAWVKTLQA